MDMRPNITTKNIIDKATKTEITDVTDALNSAFLQYDIPISWIITVAELLTKYKTLTGKEVRTAILHAQDSILSSEVHNEVNVYAPRISGVVAKVDSIEEVPQYVIDYAQEHDLPLYILGS
jgi:hypothetical protein